MGRTMRVWAARPVLAAGLALAAGAGALPGRLVASARAAEGSVVLEHPVFRYGRLTIDMPRVEARGTALSADELRDILDPASPLGLGPRLTRLSAASLAVPEVTLRQAPGPGEAGGWTMTVHDVLLTGVRAGKVDALSIRGAEAAPGTGGERDALTVGPVTVHGLDPQLAQQIATGSRADVDLPASPVLRDATVGRVALTGDGGRVVALDRVEVGAFEGRPLLDTPANLLRRLDETPGGLKPDPSNPLFAVLADAAASFELDRLALSGIAFAAGDGTGLRVGSLLLDGVGPSKLPRFAVGDAGLDAAGVHLSLKGLALSATGTPAVFARAGAFLTGQPLASAASPPAADAAGGVEFAMSGLHVALPPADADGPFPPGTVNVFDVPALTFGESAASGGATAEAHTRVEVRYDIPPGGRDPTIQTLRDLGLSHLDAAFGYRLSYDFLGRALRLDELSVGGRGVGSVTLTGRVADMPEAPLSPGIDADDAAARFGGATLRDAAATLVDEGFLARALDVIAHQSGTSPALMRAALKTKVDLALPSLLGATPAEATVAQAVDGFIDAGGTLALSAHARDGVTVRDFAAAADPSALLGRFDVRATGSR